MFSFFRRSKKSSEKNSEEKTASTVADTFKNNTPDQDTSKGGDDKLNSPGIRENIENAGDSHVHSDRETKPSNSESKNDRMEVKEQKKIKPISYASVLKKPEPVKPTRLVKPCGHGTLAVTPYIPVSAIRRNSSGTPPDSPKLEFKSYHKKNSAPISLDLPSEEPNELLKKSNELPKTQNELLKKPNELLKKPDELLKKQDELLKTPNELLKNPNELLKKPNEVLQPKQEEPPKREEPSKPERLQQESKEDVHKKNLINQEAKFQSQLNELSKQLSQRDAEVSKLRFQMEELQRDVFAKTAGMDRMQTELQAAQKEAEGLRQKLKYLDDELVDYRKRNADLTEELNKKAENYTISEREAKEKIVQLEKVIEDLNVKIETLGTQIEDLQKEKGVVESAHEKAVSEREEEKKAVEAALEKATQEKAIIDKKWEQEFEKLRTVNILKEQQLLDDFEWKLREVEKRCKKRLEEKDLKLNERLHEACKDAEMKMNAADEMMKQVEHLKLCENQVKELRDLTQEQEKNIKLMMDQQSQMQEAERGLKAESKRLRTIVDMEKENLQHMQRVHHQEILEKERTLQARLDQKKTEIAMYWEERLLLECSRLKTELEQLHNEEKTFALTSVRREKDEELNQERRSWEKKLQDSFKEISKLKSTLKEKEDSFHKEMVKTQTNTDREFMELRRLMNKIDNMHHDKFEKLVKQHDEEIERINDETEKRIKDVENNWQNQVSNLRANLEMVKEQMERESQQKIQNLIEQHRSELDEQWDNLIHQKSEAVKLVEEEYVSKYKTLEEQFYVQQKSHEAREVELLKTIDSLKNEIISKDSTVDDLYNNVDTLEGGIQVLNQEIAQQGEQLLKIHRDSSYKIRTLQEMVDGMQEKQQKEKKEYEEKLEEVRKQTQGTIEYLTRKCECLTKLFEEVRARYERRESRQEDLNTIADLRQVIAEQEKDLACINEEKRYFQMRLMNLERRFEEDEENFVDSEDFEEVPQERKTKGPIIEEPPFDNIPNGFPTMGPSIPLGPISIPPTIPECDES